MNFSQTESVQLEQLMPVIHEKLKEGNSVRLFPRGTSMLPMLRQGIDSVLLSPLPEKLSKYDLPLYQRTNGQYVLHRVVDTGETYTCIGDNQFQFETGVKHAQMIAVVSAFYRNDRLIPVENVGYRIYCRFWYYSRRWRGLLRRLCGLWRRGKGWLRRHIG